MNNFETTQDQINQMITLRRQGYSVREVAAILSDQGVSISPTTVSRHLRRAGVTGDETATQEATAARVKAARQRALEQALTLLEDAEAARERVYAPAKVVVSTPDGAQVLTLPEPPLQDVAKVLHTVERLITQAQRLLETIQEDTTEEAKSVLQALQENLEAYIALAEPDPTIFNEPGMTYDSDYSVENDPEQQVK